MQEPWEVRTFWDIKFKEQGKEKVSLAKEKGVGDEDTLPRHRD
jgi:hypothetical protein